MLLASSTAHVLPVRPRQLGRCALVKRLAACMMLLKLLLRCPCGHPCAPERRWFRIAQGPGSKLAPLRMPRSTQYTSANKIRDINHSCCTLTGIAAQRLPWVSDDRAATIDAKQVKVPSRQHVPLDNATASRAFTGHSYF